MSGGTRLERGQSDSPHPFQVGIAEMRAENVGKVWRELMARKKSTRSELQTICLC